MVNRSRAIRRELQVGSSGFDFGRDVVYPYMRRALLALLLITTTTTTLADARVEKRALVAELLEVIDAKTLMQRSFESLMGGMTGVYEIEADAVPEESRRQEEEALRVFRERVYQRVDYAKYFDEVYVPIFEKQFTTEELHLLLDLFKTRHGQKLAKILPDLGIGSAVQAMKYLNEAAESVRDDISKEEEAKHPWKKTMADLRTIATALESRAIDTDVQEYPNVSFEELESLLRPTYIREVPKTDSWGTPFLYLANGAHYRIISAGADKRFDWNARQFDAAASEPVLTDDPDADIIFQDGNFVQLPKEAAQEQR